MTNIVVVEHKGGSYGGGSEVFVITDNTKTFQLMDFGHYKQSDKSSTLKARDYKYATDLIITEECGVKTVRRLTPLECERLQGFPDNWTDIGEWTDTHGKKHKESSDSARYKALGNSICISYWKSLARKICVQYDRDITMVSLFDGIGGFPYSFESVGAKAVWASEIEEFPIAVTKARFPEQIQEGGECETN